MASRWGSILSPYVIFLQDYVSWLPFAIFGSVAIVAGFLCFFLPETAGQRRIMQTMEEAEKFYAGKLDLDEDKKLGSFKFTRNWQDETTDEHEPLLLQ